MAKADIHDDMMPESIFRPDLNLNQSASSPNQLMGGALFPTFSSYWMGHKPILVHKRKAGEGCGTVKARL